MLNKRRIVPILMSLFLLIAAGGYAFAAGFSDIKGHWAESQINKWAENGLASGYSDGTFKPNNRVTRAEFVALTNSAFGINTEGYAADFSDVAVGQWYYNDIAAASTSGYIGGYPDGTFKPKQSISRQEAASIIVRLLGLEPTLLEMEKFKDAVQIPQWSRGNIGAIVKAGLMGGYPDGTFQPGKSLTRAEAVAFLDRARDFAPGVTEGALLQGTVTLDDKAVSSATVLVFKADSYEVLKETETDSNGVFEFSLAAGTYDITAATDSQVAYQSDITLAQNKSATANLKLVPAAVISGTLYDKDEKSKVKNAEMLFTTNPTFVIYTGNDGKFTGAVLPGSTYTVRVYEPGEEDEEPVLVAEELDIGSAGTRSVGTLKAPFSVSTSVGGGGGVSSPKIKSIADIKVTVALGADYSLPTEVTANMSNGATKQVAVTWSPSTVDTSKAGVFTFQGTVSGYTSNAILTLRVEAPIGQSVVVDSEVPIAYEDGITIDLSYVADIPEGTTVTVTECSESDYEVPAVPSGQLFEVAGEVFEVEFSDDTIDFSNGVEITLPFEGTASDGLAIFYYNETDNKWECADSTVDEVNKVIKAIVYHFSKWGVANSTRVETPTAYPSAGLVAEGTEIELSTSTDGATIYYTTDGKNPNVPKYRVLYAGLIVVNADTTIKAIAVKDNMKDSHVATFEYTVSSKPYIQSITNGSVDQDSKVITLNEDPGNLSESKIVLFSPSGQSILDITLEDSSLGSWKFANGSNDITLGNSIEGVNISTTMVKLLGAGLSYQDVLEIVNYDQVFDAIKSYSSKQEFYDEVLKEVINKANDELDDDDMEALYEALNIPAINDAADNDTKDKIKDILQPAVDVYNASESDSITVEDLVGNDYVDVLAKINASDCKEDFYNAINISELYEAIAGKSALYGAINESAIINAIIEGAEDGKATVIAMALVVNNYLDSLGSAAKEEILNAIDFNKLMVVVSDKLEDELQVIVTDEADDTNQTIYTVTVQ